MPKPKGTPGGNLDPVQTAEFLAAKFAPAPDVPEGVKLAKKSFQVKLPEDLDAALRDYPDRNAWARRVLWDAAKRDGLI